jgi:hypothetical protein
MDEEQSFMPPSQSQFYEFISSAAAAEFQRDNMPFQIFQCDTMPRIATPCCDIRSVYVVPLVYSALGNL